MIGNPFTNLVVCVAFLFCSGTSLAENRKVSNSPGLLIEETLAWKMFVVESKYQEIHAGAELLLRKVLEESLAELGSNPSQPTTEA